MILRFAIARLAHVQYAVAGRTRNGSLVDTRASARYNAAANGCGPVAVLVFKTSGRGDELRWWVRLPRVRATSNRNTCLRATP